jgi:hypothetical protein
MKKITLILWILVFLTSCYSNPEDVKEIEKLENTKMKLKKSFSKLLQWEYQASEDNKYFLSLDYTYIYLNSEDKANPISISWEYDITD